MADRRRAPITSLCDRLDQYIAERCSHGGNWASPAKQVRPFVTFADSEGVEWITTGLFLHWKERFGSAGRTAWAGRLSAVRVFATWFQGIDPRTEVPPKGLIPHRAMRPKPCIYSGREICRIVAEAADLKCRTGLRGATFSTMFGLIAVTGMRIGEALALHDADVDTGGAVFRVKHAKNGRDRVIPVTGCTAVPNASGCTATRATASIFLQSGRRRAQREHRPAQLRQGRPVDRPEGATSGHEEGARPSPA